MVRLIAVVFAFMASSAFAANSDALRASSDVAWNAPLAASNGTQAESNAPTPSPVQEAVERRLNEILTPEMKANFGLFIYVSKASSGPWAQRMYVFQKAADDLLLLYDWPVSTGRETVEADARGVELSTATPAGYYELDPKRFYEKYRSTQWNEPMPYAMFLQWMDHGVQTGLAIHGTTEDGLLGMRASAGCVRLSPENARTLFTLVRDNFQGMAPKFGFDKYTRSIMNNGLMVHDGDGAVALVPGYSVLLYIDEHGSPDLEAQAY